MSLRCVIIFSAALKKGALDEAGYARMIESTTRLNTPGPISRVLPMSTP